MFVGSYNDLVAEWIHFTLFWDKTTHYRTESVHFLGLMNSATKKLRSGHVTCLEHPELAMAEVNEISSPSRQRRGILKRA